MEKGDRKEAVLGITNFPGGEKEPPETPAKKRGHVFPGWHEGRLGVHSSDLKGREKEKRGGDNPATHWPLNSVPDIKNCGRQVRVW